MSRWILLGILLQLGCSVVGATNAQQRIEFPSEEMAQIHGLGPWPPALVKDATNRVSGQPKAIELGRRLFRDARMSPVGYIACVTCHQPDRAFTDLKARAHGIADLQRNTPTLANLRLQRWFGWGGSSDSLWMASIRPILDPREFDASLDSVAKVFRRDAELSACYREVFQDPPQRDKQRTLVNVGKALAAFQETLVTERTPFDEFRDSLLKGDPSLAAMYPVPAQRGLRLFVGSARCVACHSGPNFSDGAFHRGAPVALNRDDAASPDAGRLEGVRLLKASRLNLLGPFNDESAGSRAAATRQLRPAEILRGQFRTPSLRNVAVTAPYMHDGGVERLLEAVRHREGAAAGVALSATEAEDLVAFLNTLTDRHGERRPWSIDKLLNCP